MKKILALVLASLLVLGAAVCAAGGNYLTANEQNMFYSEVFIEDGQMPAVMLSTRYASGILSHDPYYDAEYVTFPYPANAHAMSFNTDSASFYSEKTGYVYSYQAVDSSAYETFVAKASGDDECTVVAEGSDGWAAYVKCGKYSQNAYALIGVSELGTAAKLHIQMQYCGRGAKEESSLINDITDEVLRVRNGLSFAKDAPFWTENAFDGFVMRSTESNSPNVAMTYTFPVQTVNASTAKEETAREFVTRMENDRVMTMLRFSCGSMEFEYELSDYSYVEYKKENDPENVHTVRLADGYAYDIYYDDDGRAIDYLYVSRLLTDHAGRNGDDNLYLTIHLDGDDLSWPSLEELCKDLNRMVTSMTWEAPFEFIVGEAPDAPAEKEASSTAPAAPDSGWDCPDCGQHNDGNFCPNCGAKKPEDPHWFCPNCGQQNEGNFCPNCGTKKP